MTNQDLAEFYNISTQAVGRWTKDRKHRKTVQALAGAEQSTCDLIADINKLAYIYDCQWLHGVEQKRWCFVSRFPSTITVSIFYSGVTGPAKQWQIDMNLADAERSLSFVKQHLEELVYGVSSVD